MHTLLARFKHPFWFVTLVSGSILLLRCISLLITYNQTRQWLHLAVGGLIGLLVCVHCIAWWLAYPRKTGKMHVPKYPFIFGIRLIAVSQILAAVIMPFFVVNYQIVVFLLLVVVPLEIGIIDKFRWVPLSIVFTMLGAAGMLATDLFDSPNRLTYLNISQYLPVGMMLIILNIAYLVLLLWHFRLRPDAEYHVRIDLTTQQSLFFIGICTVSIFLVAGVLIFLIRSSQIERVGQNFQTIAEINAERIGNMLEKQTNSLLSLSRRETAIVEGILSANVNYEGTNEEIHQFLIAQEERWQTSEENSDFVRQYRTNDQSTALSKFRGTHNFYKDLCLTDRYGGLVAAQGKNPPHFFYGDEEWWQTTWSYGQGDIYIGNLTLDPETKFASIFIAVSVLNFHTNETIGVLASTYQIRDIQQFISRLNIEEMSEISLLDANGVIIASAHEENINQSVETDIFTLDILHAESLKQSDWTLAKNKQNRPIILAYSTLSSTSQVNLDLLRSLGWQVIIQDTQANALAETTRSIKIASLVALLVMVFVLWGATITSRIITKPIESLTHTATIIYEGDLDQQAELIGPVELVTLAQTFNALTSRLNALVENLEHKVVERTLELKMANQSMQKLNERLQDELAFAHAIQQGLIPAPKPDWSNLNVICYSVSAREIGGDFYDYHAFDDGRFGLAVGDISGKGVSAALLMAASLSQLDAAFSHAFSPAERLVYLDNAIKPYAQPHGQNCALCYVEIEQNSQGGTARMVNAGCAMPIIKWQDGSAEWVEIGGVPLGMGLGAELGYVEIKLNLSKGDMIILTSDGVIEAHDTKNTMFGFNRLEQIVKSGPIANAEAMLQHIRDEVIHFVGERDLHDDITIVVVQI